MKVKISISKRDRELRRHSLIHNQFSAPRYQNLFRYSWHKAGYFDEHPGEFLTPQQYCFPPKIAGPNDEIIEECQVENCSNDWFIRCSHCSAALCWTHFVDEFHYHDLIGA